MTCSHDPAATARGIGRIEIVERSPTHPDAGRLLRAFYRDQVNLYGFADPADLDPREYTAPHGAFAVAYHDGAAVGCGGYHWYDGAASTAEIKKTYVVRASRGLGVGRALLAWLEDHAARAGGCRAILETGVRNTAALNLFTSAGYQPIERYIVGRDPAINRALARSLTSLPQPDREGLRPSA